MNPPAETKKKFGIIEGLANKRERESMLLRQSMSHLAYRRVHLLQLLPVVSNNKQRPLSFGCSCRRHRRGWKRRRMLATSSSSTMNDNNDNDDDDEPMDLRRIVRYLQLESFTKEELHDAFTTIVSSSSSSNEQVTTTTTTIMDQEQLKTFLLQRIHHLEKDNGLPSMYEDEVLTNSLRQEYANRQAWKLLRLLNVTNNNDNNDDSGSSSSLTRNEFVSRLEQMATAIDVKGILPISISMLLVGSSVGIITPIMPFVVENLGLTPGQYGMVVSAFALAKMAFNVPSAIFVERHGRKPYLVYSLSVIALGVGGIGLATSFEHLVACRLLTGMGVAALSTAATLSIADVSTPRNRASTMAPIMSAFAAGTALGPALGGFLADSIGIQPTFYLVGVSYIGLTAVNYFLLQETKASPIIFPWQQQEQQSTSTMSSSTSVGEAIKDAVGQWAPLMRNETVRNVVVMNGFYWVALAGSQMTLLPLMLTDPSGLAMSATGVGSVYMGMSAVQVFGNPILARFVDRLGKGPAIAGGSSLIALSMAMLPMCTDMYQLAGTLGVWATGSTMLSTAPVAYISDTVDDEKRAQAIALLRTSGDVGFLLGATGVGALADWTGDMAVAMQTSAGLLFTATGWFVTRQFLSSKVSPPR